MASVGWLGWTLTVTLAVAAACGPEAPPERPRPAATDLADARFAVASDPRDRDAHLRLARAYDRSGLPGGALRHFGRVAAVTDLDGADRRRYAALLLDRAGERVALGDGAALADVNEARRLGAEPPAELAAAATFAAALAAYRRPGDDARAEGDRLAAAGAVLAAGDPRGAAAAPDTAPLVDLAAAAAWLDEGGARRAAFDLYQSYVRRGGRDRHAVGAALRLHRWWHGDRRAPEAELVLAAIAMRADTCTGAPRLEAPGCAAVLAELSRDPERAPGVAATAARHGWRTAEPELAGVMTVLALRRWLSGDSRGLGVDLARLVDLEAVAREPERLPAFAAATILRTAGQADRAAAALDAALTAPPADPVERAVVVMEAAVAGRDLAELERLAGAPGPLLGAVLDRVRGRDRPPLAAGPAAARWYAATAELEPLRDRLALDWELGAPAAPALPLGVVDAGRLARGADGQALAEVAAAYLVDPALADRRARDLVDGAAAVGTRAAGVVRLFHELGDPARADRWAHRLVDASPAHPRYLLLAGATAAAAGDPARAEIFFTRGAASSGDAGAASLAASRVLLAFGHPVPALGAGKRALQLIAPGHDDEALATVSAADRVLGRDDSVLEARLAARRAQSDRDRALASGDPDGLRAALERDPTDAAVAAAYVRLAGAAAAGVVSTAASFNPDDAELRCAAAEALPGEAGLDWLLRCAAVVAATDSGFAELAVAATAHGANRLAEQARRRVRPPLPTF